MLSRSLAPRSPKQRRRRGPSQSRSSPAAGEGWLCDRVVSLIVGMWSLQGSAHAAMKKRFDMHSVQVAYTDEGHGRPFVLVHGAGANGSYWKLLAAHLAQAHADARIVAPDLFGHGDTPPWTPAQLAGRQAARNYDYTDDVQLLEQLADRIEGDFDLVGHSSGGAVCLQYALRNPARVRKLVVAEPMLPGILSAADPAAHAEVTRAYERAHAAVDSGESEQAARCLFEYILGDGQWSQLGDGIRKWMTKNVACTLAAHSRASLAMRLPADHFEAIACPVLMLFGERTRAPFRRVCGVIADSLANVRSVAIPKAAHNAPLTHAPMVNEAIAAFL